MPVRIPHVDGEIQTSQQMDANYIRNLSSLLSRQCERIQASIKPLHALEHGQAGMIVAIQTKTPEQLGELTSMGIVPHVIVRLIDRYSRYVVFNVERKKYVADEETASGIAVLILG
jgi:Fe2+ transport system protein FeoA